MKPKYWAVIILLIITIGVVYWYYMDKQQDMKCRHESELSYNCAKRGGLLK